MNMRIDEYMVTVSRAENRSAIKQNNPKVSIGMPVYNGEKYIREALDSLIAQTFTDYELIISDNASTDSTEVIIREYAAKDARIRYVRQTKNRGAIANFQFVLDEAFGEYFMWAAADDIRAPDCLETYLMIIKNAGGAFTNYCRTNFDNGEITEIAVPALSSDDASGNSIKSFLKNNRPSLIYGLFRTSVIKNCFEGLNFDWADSFTVLSVINKHGFNTLNASPKYFAGYRRSYVVKPSSGQYIRPFTYFIKALPLAITAGPIGLVHHLKTVVLSLIINAKIFTANILSKAMGGIKHESSIEGHMK